MFMIRPSNSSLKVYLYAEPVDMRRQIDGLAAIVEQQLSLSPFDKSLFVFVNKARDKVKICKCSANPPTQIPSDWLG
jgi:transposase